MTIETADLVPVFGLLLVALLTESFTGTITAPLSMIMMAGLMLYANRTETEVEAVVEYMAQGMGVVYTLYVLTRIPNRIMRFFKMGEGGK